jgi:SAM-dependent methyltransferase
MSYNKDFFDAYRKDVAQPEIRAIHDKMFDIFKYLDGYEYRCRMDIVEFGCGIGEFYNYLEKNHGCVDDYIGIDKNWKESGMPVIQADYLQDDVVLPFKPIAFVSIFSSELIMPWTKAYEFYEKIFKEYPTINTGMVAGFYYKDQRLNDLKVKEVYDIESYQSNDNLRSYDHTRSNFTELRSYVPRNVPNMFGPNVVEVWKYLIRK